MAAAGCSCDWPGVRHRRVLHLCDRICDSVLSYTKVVHLVLVLRHYVRYSKVRALEYRGPAHYCGLAPQCASLATCGHAFAECGYAHRRAAARMSST